MENVVGLKYQHWISVSTAPGYAVERIDRTWQWEDEKISTTLFVDCNNIGLLLTYSGDISPAQWRTTCKLRRNELILALSISRTDNEDEGLFVCPFCLTELWRRLPICPIILFGWAYVTCRPDFVNNTSRVCQRRILEPLRIILFKFIGRRPQYLKRICKRGLSPHPTSCRVLGALNVASGHKNDTGWLSKAVIWI